MKNLVLFDMDGTLTPPRSHLDYNLVDTLRELARFAEIGIVTGSDLDYLKQQCGFLLEQGDIKLKLHLLPCNGTKHCAPPSYKHKSYSLNHKRDMRKHLGEANFTKIMKKLIDYQNHVVSHYDIPLTGHFISYRESMLNWCPVGRNASINDRLSFKSLDKSLSPSFRSLLLEQIKEELETSRIPVEIKLGGDTSFDIFPKGWDKTYALKHFSDYEIYFLGDRCGEDGNDKEIYDALHPNSWWVESPKHTKKILQEILIPRLQ